MTNSVIDLSRRRRLEAILAGACSLLLCAAVFASSAQAAATLLGATGSDPRGFAIDSAGNIYTASPSSSNVTKLTPGGTSTILGTTASGPVAITIDSAGNVYTANSSYNNVTKITPGGVSSVLGLAGGITPVAIAVDWARNVYIANQTSSNVTKITPDGTSAILGSTGGNQPRAIAVDSAGNVYTANIDQDTVSKITPDGTSTILGTTGDQPIAITVDSAGNVYTANYGPSNVSKITPNGNSTILGLTGSSPWKIAIDSAGNIYTAHLNDQNVTKLTPGGQSSVVSDSGGSYAANAMTIDSAGNIYTAVPGGLFPGVTGNVWKIAPTLTGGIPDIFPAPPAPPSAPTASAGSPGSGTVTVAVAVNPISAAFGAPSSYTISSTQDGSKSCEATGINPSCSVTGLTIGAASTFTARANLNSWQTAASAASNSATPTPAPTRTPKPATSWSSPDKKGVISAIIMPQPGVSYTVDASSKLAGSSAVGKKLIKGSCKNVKIKQGKKKVARVSCQIKLTKGKWLVSIRPKKNGVFGIVNSKIYTIKK